MFWGFEKLKIEIYGESHSDAIGVKLGGLPRGFKIDETALLEFTSRRKAGGGAWSTPRIEPDAPVFLEGVENGIVTGDVHAVIYNQNVKSRDYSSINTTPRPSHADLAYCMKEKTIECPVGGGRFSARLTAPLCIAGGIAKQILAGNGIEVCGYVSRIGSVEGKNYKNSEITTDEIKDCWASPLPCLSNGEEMTQEVLKYRENGDSVGGSVDIVITGLHAGLGDYLFSGLEGKLSLAVFGVPAVKAVEFGIGTDFAQLNGSKANDPIFFDGEKIVTKTNNCGGITGGISNGMPVTLRASLKPTPSISMPQQSVDLATNENVEIKIKGRHDSCIVPRAVAGIESAVALALLDYII
ncbi:MAG: chorismate synthase [Bacillota bacterium]